MHSVYLFLVLASCSTGFAFNNSRSQTARAFSARLNSQLSDRFRALNEALRDQHPPTNTNNNNNNNRFAFPPVNNFPGLPPSFRQPPRRLLTNEKLWRINANRETHNDESSFNSFCECGKENLNTASRVVSGADVVPNDRFPWMALITENSSQLCGGAIINEWYILTAAHCLDTCDEDQQLCKVKLGTYNIKDPGAVFEIESVKRHEEYNFNANDIGLIKLKKPIKFSQSIRPICLPRKLTLPQVKPYTGVIHSAGWGLTGDGKESEVLMQFSGEDWLKTDARSKSCREQLCLRQVLGRFESGDSGGPAWILRKDERAELIAIVSHYRLRRMRLTRVPLFIDWIKSNTKNSSSSSTCKQ